MPPTDRTASSARFSRSTRRRPAASTSSSSGRSSDSDDERHERRSSARRPSTRSTRMSITSAARQAARLILEYGDYECPYSRQAFRAIERVEQEASGGIRFAFRHFPLVEIHPHALAAAAAAEAAALQDRFWDMHELLFHRQKALEDDDLRRYAAELGLDASRFDQDRSSAAVLRRIQRDVESGQGVGRGARNADVVHRRRRAPRRLRRCHLARGNQQMTGIEREASTEPMMLPELHLADWRPTKDTLHLYAQIVGKIRFATTAPRNHWWNVPLYVDVRGLTTRRLHHHHTTFEITIDVVDHALVDTHRRRTRAVVRARERFVRRGLRLARPCGASRAGHRRSDQGGPVRRPDDDTVSAGRGARGVGSRRDRALRPHPRLVGLRLRGVQRLVQRQDQSRPPVLAQPRPRRHALFRPPRTTAATPIP